jgi:hypothetical protein
MRLLMLAAAVALGAQSAPAPRHLTIPFLANATKPAALEFEAAECEVDAAGTSMDCAFRQVFLTTSDLVPDTCLVTTNGYERRFERIAPTATRWTSRQTPQGRCGVVDVVTLDDGGGGKWTMTLTTVVTSKETSCQAARGEEGETFTWENIRRPLPCRFVQPGGLLP